MWHELFHFIDRAEQSLREHHILWAAGVGSATGVSVLMLGILWQQGMFAPAFEMFEGRSEPAALVGAEATVLTQVKPESTAATAVRTEPTPEARTDEAGGATSDATFDIPIALIGETVVRIAVGSAYTDDGAALVGGDDVPVDVFQNGMRVEEVMIDTSAPGEHTIEYRPRTNPATRTGATRTVFVE